MIPSCPNVLSIPTKHVVVNCLAFFPGNCLNLAANVFFFFLPIELEFVSNTLHSKASTNETHEVSNRGKVGGESRV